MAKHPTHAKGEASEGPRILPLPESVIRHHGEGEGAGKGSPGLFAIMGEWAAQQKVPPVLLITGIPGLGKRSIGHYLAQWILCERSPFGASRGQSDDASGDLFGGGGFGFAEERAPAEAAPTPAKGTLNQPCGECSSCQRAVKGSWVDFTEILPEEGEALKIDQFRQLKSTQGFGAHESSYRVILIPNSDRMTPQAANSILKLLEEPPAGWIFFLTASDPTLLLPTIVSRCQTLRLKPFSPATLESLLADAGVAPARRLVCATLAHGSWGKALDLAQDEAWEKRKSIFELLTHPTESVPTLVDWAAAEPRNLDQLLSQLEQITADLVKWSVSESPAESYLWSNADGKTALIQHAKALTLAAGSQGGAREFWLARAERIARARQESLAPLNRKLLIQDLLLPWLNVRPSKA